MKARTALGRVRGAIARAALAALVSLASCTSASASYPCGGELTDCGICVPLAYDDRNCGACGNVCPDEMACVRGACASKPPGGGGGTSSAGGAAGQSVGAGSSAGGAAAPAVGGSGGSGATASGPGGSSAASVGGSSGGEPCLAPLRLCGAACVDVATDALHCGSCASDCSLGVCQLGVCSPLAVGHQILFGMDFSKVPGNHTGERRMLGNAAFLGVSSSSGHWKVLGFDAHASPTVPAVDGILKAEAPTRGVTDLQFVHVASVAAMLATLAPAQANAVVLYDQPKASLGELAKLGAPLGLALDAFARGGGLVILLSGGLGANEMWTFAAQAGLFPVTGFHALEGGALLDGSAPLDALSVGIATPLAAPISAGWWDLPAGGDWDVVLADHASQRPVVVHRAISPKP